MIGRKLSPYGLALAVLLGFFPGGVFAQECCQIIEGGSDEGLYSCFSSPTFHGVSLRAECNGLNSGAPFAQYLSPSTCDEVTGFCRTVTEPVRTSISLPVIFPGDQVSGAMFIRNVSDLLQLIGRVDVVVHQPNTSNAVGPITISIGGNALLPGETRKVSLPVSVPAVPPGLYNLSTIARAPDGTKIGGGQNPLLVRAPPSVVTSTQPCLDLVTDQRGPCAVDINEVKGWHDATGHFVARAKFFQRQFLLRPQGESVTYKTVFFDNPSSPGCAAAPFTRVKLVYELGSVPGGSAKVKQCVQGSLVELGDLAFGVDITGFNDDYITFTGRVPSEFSLRRDVLGFGAVYQLTGSAPVADGVVLVLQ